jgi:hypothetical protein
VGSALGIKVIGIQRATHSEWRLPQSRIGGEKMEEYGIDELKNEIVEGVPLDEISKKDIKWCAVKWHLIMGFTYAGMLADEVFKNPERYYGSLMVALEKRIEALGGKVVPMKSVEIPK